MKIFYITIIAAFVATAAAQVHLSQCCAPGCNWCDSSQPCGNVGSTDCSKNSFYTVCCSDARKGRTQVIEVLNTTKASDE